MGRDVIPITPRVSSGSVKQQIAIVITAGRIVENENVPSPGAARPLERHVASIVIDDENVRAAFKASGQRVHFTRLIG